MIIKQLDNEYKFIQILEDDGSCRVLKPTYDVGNESDEIKLLADNWTDEIKSAYADSIAVSEEESPE